MTQHVVEQAVWTECVRTPLSFDEAARHLRNALLTEIRDVSDECLALALAKCALETGRFQAMYGYNYGNIRPTYAVPCQFQCLPICNEIDHDDKLHWYTPEGEVVSRTNLTVIGKRWDIPPGHPASRFQAYAGPTDGAYQYVDFMARGANGRFAPAFARLVHGDAPGMVAAMKRARYMTADEQAYARPVISLQREYLGKLKNLPVEPYEPTDDEFERLMATIQGQRWHRIQDELFTRDTEPPDTEPNA